MLSDERPRELHRADAVPYELFLQLEGTPPPDHGDASYDLQGVVEAYTARCSVEHFRVEEWPRSPDSPH